MVVNRRNEEDFRCTLQSHKLLPKDCESCWDSLYILIEFDHEDHLLVDSTSMLHAIAHEFFEGGLCYREVNRCQTTARACG